MLLTLTIEEKIQRSEIQEPRTKIQIKKRKYKIRKIERKRFNGSTTVFLLLGLIFYGSCLFGF